MDWTVFVPAKARGVTGVPDSIFSTPREQRRIASGGPSVLASAAPIMVAKVHLIWNPRWFPRGLAPWEWKWLTVTTPGPFPVQATCRTRAVEGCVDGALHRGQRCDIRTPPPCESERSGLQCDGESPRRGGTELVAAAR